MLAIISAGLSYSADNPGYNSPGVKIANDMHTARLARLQARTQARNKELAAQKQERQNSEKQIQDLTARNAVIQTGYDREKAAKDKLQKEQQQTQAELNNTKTELLKKQIRELIEKHIVKIAEDKLIERYTAIQGSIPDQIKEETIYSTIEVGFEQYKGYCGKRLGEATILPLLTGIANNTDPDQYIKEKQVAIDKEANGYADKLITEFNNSLTQELNELTANNETTIEAILEKYKATLEKKDDDEGDKNPPAGDHINAKDVNAYLDDE